jgi:hypothetical protein
VIAAIEGRAHIHSEAKAEREMAATAGGAE